MKINYKFTKLCGSSILFRSNYSKLGIGYPNYKFGTKGKMDLHPTHLYRFSLIFNSTVLYRISAVSPPAPLSHCRDTDAAGTPLHTLNLRQDFTPLFSQGNGDLPFMSVCLQIEKITMENKCPFSPPAFYYYYYIANFCLFFFRLSRRALIPCFLHKV